MEILRYKYIFVVLTITLTEFVNTENSTTVCPFTKIIEDIFKIHNNKTSKDITLKDYERTKIFLNSIAKVTVNEENIDKAEEDKLVNDIIASINRIKSNLTAEKSADQKLNEAVIINVPSENEAKVKQNVTDNKSAESVTIDDPINYGDKDYTNLTHINETLNLNGSTEVKHELEDRIVKKENKTDFTSSTTEKINYVEILTIEPNNTNNDNTTANNIIEVLKYLMPIFNNSLVKQHNITLVERNHFKNNSFANKNVSTIIVTFCDKNNSLGSDNTSMKEVETDLKANNDTSEYDDSDPDTEYGEVNYDDSTDLNLTIGEKKDILEAANYGIQKMHELYTVLEPKLYSMGLWLEANNPARFVAAFNAPVEDIGKYTRYGYASLQASTKLKQLTSGSTEDGAESRGDEVQFPTASALRQSPLLQHCPLRGVPKCPPASKRYRTHDGTCNNLNRPRWGSTMTPVQRFLPPSYSDGLQAPRRSIAGTQLPSAREISSLVHEDQYIENPSITHLLMQWGQFVDHDITSSSQTRGFNGSVPRCCRDGGREFMPKELMHPECMPIAVPPSDPFYGPRGVRCLDFIRSSPAPHEDCALGWREQLNQVSAYIDGSPIYASSARQSDRLRLFRNGMLQYGRVAQRRPGAPPERVDELCRGGAVSTDCFRSGDARVNEHPGLVAAHIVWLRQHNRMAQELAHLNPHWSDEKIYQETRKIVGAMIQHITYREFLPIVLGPEVMRLFELELQKKGYYRGYDPKTNASPASSFGSAAFRFGHSLVQPSMMRFDRFHRPLTNNVSLHAELTNPSNIWSIGAVDRLFLGMVNQPIQTRDEFITEELTNHLFQTPSFNFGMDLAAINIQRGRDHGIPSYTEWREPCGLSAIKSFGDLFKVMPSRVVRKLQSLYRHVDDIDLFTGGLAERPVVGGLVGPTFACIIAQQFSNLRKGDRFWYENGGFESSFTPAQLQQIRRISFAQILCHALDSIDSIQPFVFLSADNAENGRISCQNGLLNDFDLSPWIEITSQFDNNISKFDDEIEASTARSTTLRPKRTKPTTTTRKPTTKKTLDLVAAASNKVKQKKPVATNLNKTDTNLTNKLNKTDSTFKGDDSDTDILTLTVPNIDIDDKLDFKNKSSRLEDETGPDSRKNNPPTPAKQYNDYEEEDNVQSVQSVVINNLPYKRPYHYNNKRPVMTVTENVNKYTYLINYVPRPTESWRQTTRKKIDRDVVKVTYQSYDDTYRRPNRPYYYDRHESADYYRPQGNKDDYDDRYRNDRPTNDKNDDFHSSARSNNDNVTPRPIATVEKIDSTYLATENPYKLVTFGYVGTYKGDLTDDKTDTEKTEPEALSKEFSTYENNDDDKTMKLSTFFFYETVTKPYNSGHRPTRRHDDAMIQDQSTRTKTKYYYIKNVLHKYPDDDVTDKPTVDVENRETPLNPNSSLNLYEDAEDRSVSDKLDFPDEETAKQPPKIKHKIKKPSPAKTPSVSFQVIPSENSPSQWAIYDEKDDLPDILPHRMPPIRMDPHALKEFPRPLVFASLRRRKPGRF